MTNFDSTTTDALVWAEEFVKMVKENPGMAANEGTMTGWFANAIMAGYDEAQRKYQMVNFHDFLMQSMQIQFDEAMRKNDESRTD